MSDKHTPAPWQEGKCNSPMWVMGTPAGCCGNKAYGHKLPEKYLQDVLGWRHTPYCVGHACPAHGGPGERDVRIFRDGTTDEGRVMWCAVMPDFINLQESPAGFDGNPLAAVSKLHAAIAKAEASK